MRLNNMNIADIMAFIEDDCYELEEKAEKIFDYITDLEAKLAEKEKTNKQFKTLYFNKCLDYEHLHEKLEDKCAEFELKEYDYKQTIFEKEQDKISFAVEQLKKVKNCLTQELENVTELLDPLEYEDYHEFIGCGRGYKNSIETIDNQIKQLKGK